MTLTAAQQLDMSADQDAFGETPHGWCTGIASCDGLPDWGEAGGVLIERRELNPTESIWIPVGYGPAGAVDSEIITTLPHTAQMSYHYRARHVGGNGYVDAEASALRRFDYETDDQYAVPMPHRPINLTAVRIAGGAFELHFTVDLDKPGSEPERFQCFSGQPEFGPILYDTPLEDALTGLEYIAFAGQRGYVFTTGAYLAGIAVVFAARSQLVSGGTQVELNEYATPALFPLSGGPTGVQGAKNADA